MAYMRRDVRGTTGQDIEKINSNFMDIFDKVFGNINFSDADIKTRNKINTQWIPIQGEGNLDSSNPLYIRFFVPPNTTEVKSTNFNVMTEHYRMDSSITSSAESKQEVINVVSSASPSSSETSTTEPKSSYTSSTEPSSTQSSSTEPSSTQSSSTEPQRALSSSSQTVGVSSVSSVTVGVSSVGGGGVTSNGGGGAVKYVRKWGEPGVEVPAPTGLIYPYNGNIVNSNMSGFLTTDASVDSRLVYGVLIPDGTRSTSSTVFKYLDLYNIQHSHDIPSHTHSIPSHSHSVTLKGHSHSVTMQPHDHSITVPSHYHNVTIPSHYHNVTIPSHNHSVTIPSHNHKITIPSHTHTVTGSVTIPSHSHTLNEGIKVSSTSPSNVKFHINDSVFATLQGSNSNNNIDITDKIKIGEWNTIKITSSTVARATLYGTLEIIIK